MANTARMRPAGTQLPVHEQPDVCAERRKPGQHGRDFRFDVAQRCGHEADAEPRLGEFHRAVSWGVILPAGTVMASALRCGLVCMRMSRSLARSSRTGMSRGTGPVAQEQEWKRGTGQMARGSSPARFGLMPGAMATVPETRRQRLHIDAGGVARRLQVGPTCSTRDV